MNIQITCKHIAHTHTLEQHARTRLSKIITFLENHRPPIDIRMILTGHPSHAHQEVHLHVSAPGYRCDVQREGAHIEKLIDLVIDCAYDILREEKERKISDREQHSIRDHTE